ncbi:hypothetical protein [Pseudomonas grimontii]|uniref:hypothetical protein n=1 Tax=Pseudomonas grimontii TaxID=129847 RepID=UPI00387AA3DD
MKLILAMLLMFSGYAFAGCNSVNDLDQRAYCSAKQSGRSTDCNGINDLGLRAQCESEGR